MTKFVLAWKKDKCNVFEARVIGNANQSSPSYSDVGLVGDLTEPRLTFGLLDKGRVMKYLLSCLGLSPIS